MKKTNRLSRLLAMLLALAMLVNSQGMTSMAAVIGGVTGSKKQTEAPQTETEPATEAVAQTEAQEPESVAETELASEAQGETELESELETEIESESESEGLTAAEIAEDETEAEAGVYTYDDDTVSVVATVSDPAAFPEGTKLVVKQIEIPQSEIAEREAGLDETQILLTVVRYDIHFEYEGKEIEPPEGVTVNVQMVQNEVHEEEIDSDNVEVQIDHIKEDGEVESISVDDAAVAVDGGVQEVNFEADSFSIYDLVVTDGVAPVDVDVEGEGGEEEIDESGSLYVAFQGNGKQIVKKLEIEDGEVLNPEDVKVTRLYGQNGEETDNNNDGKTPFYPKPGETYDVTIFESTRDDVPENQLVNQISALPGYKKIEVGDLVLDSCRVGDLPDKIDLTGSNDIMTLRLVQESDGESASYERIEELLGITNDFGVFTLKYTAPTTHTEATIVANEVTDRMTSQFNFSNQNFKRTNNKITITKTYTIYNDDGTTSPYVGQQVAINLYRDGQKNCIASKSGTTDAKGECVFEFEHLTGGTYHFYEVLGGQEIMTPGTFEINGEKVKVTYNKNTGLTLNTKGYNDYSYFNQIPQDEDLRGAENGSYVVLGTTAWAQYYKKVSDAKQAAIENIKTPGKSEEQIDQEIAQLEQNGFTMGDLNNVFIIDENTIYLKSRNATIVKENTNGFDSIDIPGYFGENKPLWKASRTIAHMKTGSATVHIVKADELTGLNVTSEDNDYIIVNVDMSGKGDTFTYPGQYTIDGKAISTNFGEDNDVRSSKILWNFYDYANDKPYKGTLTQGGKTTGIILAPECDLFGASGEIGGTVIASHYTHNDGEIHQIQPDVNSESDDGRVSNSIGSKPQEGSLEIKKNVTVNGKPTSGTLVDGDYKFTITGPEGFEPQVVTITIKNGQQQNEVRLGGLAPGNYTVTEELTPAQEKLGITVLDPNPVTVYVEAGDTAAVATATFTNNRTIEGAFELEARKTVNGEVPSAQEKRKFTFTLKKWSGSGWSRGNWGSVLQTTQNEDGGKVTFGGLKMDGTLLGGPSPDEWYLIEEKQGDGAYSYSTAQYIAHVEMKVTDWNLFGYEYKIKVTYYSVDSGKLEEAFTGREINSVFAHEIASWEVVDTEEGGKWTEGSASNVNFDNKPYGSLKITKTVEGDTAPTAETKYTIEVTGKLTSQQWEAVAAANKSVAGLELIGKENAYTGLRFTLSVKKGESKFVQLNALPEGTYTVAETTQDEAFKTTYTVKADKDTAASPAGDPAAIELALGAAAEVDILNSYASKTKIKVEGTKTVEVENGDGDAPEKKYTFKLYTCEDENYRKSGNPIQAYVTGSGDFDFGDIAYEETGDHYYLVEEEEVEDDGFVKNTQVYRVEVHVILEEGTDGKPALKAAKTVYVQEDGEWVEYEGEKLSFVNTYEYGKLTVKKSVAMVGESDTSKIPDDEYTIYVEPDDKTVNLEGVKVAIGGTATVTTFEDGKIVLKLQANETAVLSNLPIGTYTVTEDVDGKVYVASYQVDDEKADTAEVGFQVENKLSAEVDVLNTYPAWLDASFKGTKALANGTLEPEQFEFEISLTEVKGATMGDAVFADGMATAKNDKDGNFSFGPVTFKKAGVYTFEVTETSKDDDKKNIKADTTTYKVEVTVSLNEDKSGYEVTEARYQKDSGEWQELGKDDTDGKYILPPYTVDGVTGTFINKVTKGGLKIKKRVVGESKDFEGEFYFLVSRVVDGKTVYYDAAGTELDEENKRSAILSLTYPSSGTDDEDDDGDGSMPSITVNNLEPDDYTVTEVDVDEDGNPVARDSSFLYEVKGEGAVTVEAGEVAETTVTNTKVKGEIEVTKKVEGETTEDTVFHVGLFTKSADGTYAQVSGTRPETIKKGETVTFKDLAPDTYYVYETDEKGKMLDGGSVYGKYIVDEENGKSAEITNKMAAPKATVELVNTYKATELKLKGRKIATRIEDGTFTFEIYDTSDPAKKVAEGTYTISEDKDTSFGFEPSEDAFRYELDDLDEASEENPNRMTTFTYTVKELPPASEELDEDAELYYDAESDIYYDVTTKTLEVTAQLATDEAGEITGIEIAGVTVDGKPILKGEDDFYDFTDANAFRNFKAEPTSLEIPVEKKITGPVTEDAKKKQFTFTLTADAENADVYRLVDGEKTKFESGQVTIIGEGKGKFDELHFEKAGTYKFTLTEADFKEDDIKGFTKDQSEYEIVIEVALEGQKLVVKTATWQQTKDKDGEAATGEKNSFLTEEGAVVTTPAFTNDYDVTEADTKLSVEKVVKTENGVTAPEREFKFKLTAGTATPAEYLTGEDAAELKPYYKTEDGKLEEFISEEVTLKAGEIKEFPQLFFEAAGTYTFTMEEIAGNPAAPGWKMDARKYHITIVVEDVNSKLKVTSRTYTVEVTTADGTTVEDTEDLDKVDDGALAGVVTFTNEYGVTDTAADLKVTKKITGFEESKYKRTFEFTLKAAETNTGTYGIKDESGEFQPFSQQTVTVVGEDTASFPSIIYKTPGDYYYMLEEKELPNDNVGYMGYTKDATVYDIWVHVEDTNGTLTATTKYKKSTDDDSSYMDVDGTIGVSFTNTYKVDAAEFKAGVEKKITGLPEGAEVLKRDFIFSMKAYETAETTGYGYMSYDETNGYTNEIKADAEIGTVTIHGAGKDSFPQIFYNKEGTYTYLITEEELGADYAGYTKDPAEYIVTVRVEEQEDGSFTTSATYVPASAAAGVTPKPLTEGEDGAMFGVVFDNYYMPADTSVKVPVEKTVKGIDNTLVAGKTFWFDLYKAENDSFALADGAEALRSTFVTIGLDGSGKSTFADLLYSADVKKTSRQGGVGTYYYVVKERDLTDENAHPGYKKDDKTYQITVVVTDDGTGALKATVTVKQGSNDSSLEGITFENIYEASGSESITGTKGVEPVGATLKEFAFGIYTDEEGTTPAPGKNVDPQIAQNAVGGENPGSFGFTFRYTMDDLANDDGTFKTTDTKTYYILEQDTDLPGYTKSKDVYKVEVTVTDQGNGDLTVEPELYKKVVAKDETEGETVRWVPAETVEFINTYAAEASWKLGGVKTVNEGAIALDEKRVADLNEKVKFELYQLNTNTGKYDIPIDEQTLKLEDGKAVFHFDTTKLSYDQTDIGETYYYQVVETQTVKNDAMGGYTVDPTVYTYSVHIDDIENGTLKLTITDQYGKKTEFTGNATENVDEITVSFDNTYTATGDVSFETSKAINGRELKDTDTFTFKVWTVRTGEDGKPLCDEYGKPVLGEVVKVDDEAVTEDGEELAATVTTSGENKGEVVFDKKIPYTLADAGKTYYYAIVEEVPADDEKAGGITYDADPVLYKVTVTDDGSGTLQVSAPEPIGDKSSFTNDYEAYGDIDLSTTKTLEGRDMEDEEFTFEITHTFTPAGSEESQTLETKTVKSSVGSAGEAVEIALESADCFDYKLVGEENYSDVGTHTYMVREVEPTDNTKLAGVDYDDTVYEITVEVTDDGNGTLNCKVSGDAGKVAGDTTGKKYELVKKAEDGTVKKGFTNKYTANGSVKFETTKTLVGRALKTGEFRFAITHSYTDKDGVKHVDTKLVRNGVDENAAAVDFGSYAFTLADVGTHSFTVSELNPTGTDRLDGVIYDGTTYTVTVKVSDKGDGTLDVDVSGDAVKDEATDKYLLRQEATDTEAAKEGFTNIYTTKQRTGVELKKILDGMTLTEGAFRFVLEEKTDEGWVPIGEPVTNGSDGKIDFNDAIEITLEKLSGGAEVKGDLEKTYSYRVREQKPSEEEKAEKGQKDMIYDIHNYFFNVTASYDYASGVLTLTNNAITESKSFTNTWTAEATVPFEATKVLDGRSLRYGDGEEEFYKFHFALYDVTNAGEFTKDEDGNVVIPEGAVLKLEADNDADGAVDLGSIKYELKDIRKDGEYQKETTFKYAIVEAAEAAQEGITYDTSVKYVTVKVVYDADAGTLKADIVEEKTDSLIFTNTYDTDAKASVSGKKILNGRALKDKEFHFAIYDAADVNVTYVTSFDRNGGQITDRIVSYRKGAEPIATADNDTDGSFSFENFATYELQKDLKKADGTYETPKLYRYRVVEQVTDPETKITYDTSVKDVTVTVTYDLATGKMKAEPNTTVMDLTFTNTYDTQEEIVLGGRKTMEGRDLTEDYGFSFNVYEADKEGNKLSGTPVTTGRTDADGEFTFDDKFVIRLADMWNEETGAYDDEKDFYYLAEEVQDKETDEDSTLTYAEPQLLTLTATYDMGSGDLKLAWTDGVNAADQKVEFTNKYTTSVEKELEGWKSLIGRKLKDEDKYQFEVYRDEDVTVTTDEEDDTAILTKKNDKVEPVLKGSNDESGKISFTGKLHYDLEDLAVKDKETGEVTYPEKEFVYWVVEVIPDTEDESITYDRNAYKAVVTVSYNAGTGKMSAEIAYDGNGFSFTNEYTAKDDIGLDAAKTMTGRDLTEDDVFLFTLEDDPANGRKTVVDGKETVVNKGNDIIFPDGTIEITLDDMDDAKYGEGRDENGLYTKEFYYTLKESPDQTVDAVKNDTDLRELTLIATYNYDTGVLEVHWAEVEDGYKTFVNDYDASGSLSFNGLKTVNVGAATGTIDLTEQRIADLNEKVEFKLQRLDAATGEYVTIADSTPIGKDGSFGFTFHEGESLSYTEDNIGDAFTYRIVEVQKVSDDAMGGYGIDSTERIYNVGIEDSEKHDGNLKLTVTDADGNVLNATAPITVTFNNSYEAKNSVTLNVDKTLTGRDMESGEFTFEVREVDEEGNIAEEALTVKDAESKDVVLRATNHAADKNTADKIVFPVIPYTLKDVGSYTYAIVEVKGDSKGVTYDDVAVIVRVTVTDDGSGTLKVEKTTEGEKESFINTYHAEGKAVIDGTKKLNGRALKDGEFTFNVVRVDPETGEEKIVGTAPNKGGVFSIAFAKDIVDDKEVLFDQDDIGATFDNYKLVEEKVEGNNIDFDPTVIGLSVTVEDDPDESGKSVGKLKITVTADKPEVGFINTYTAKGEAALQANKTLTGERKGSNAFVDDEFTFTAELVNTAQRPKDSLVKDSYSGTAKSSGTVSFDKIEFTEADADMTYIFRITEDPIKTESGNVKKSAAVYYAKVVVGPAEGGSRDTKVTDLETSVTYHSEASCTEENQIDISKVSFINEYHATGNVTFDVWKKLNDRSGKALQAGEFTFKVAEMYGDDVVWLKNVNGLITATNDADGHVQFPEGMVPYNQNDQRTHVYRIYEVIPQAEDNKVGGVSYDSGYVEVTVTVTDENGDGTLTVSKSDYTYHDKDGNVVSREGGNTFINEYEADGTAGFTGVKTVSGNRADKDLTGEFTFKVYEKVKDAQGKETEQPTDMVGATDADGNIVFTPAQFTYTQDQTGTHTYVIREDEGEDESIRYTAGDVTVTVEVTDTGNGGTGALETVVTYPEGGMKFVNDYVANGGITFKGHKELTGNRGEVDNDNEFTFVVKEVKSTETGNDKAFATETRTEVARVSGGANEDFEFPEIPYTQADIGTHTYEVYEVIPEDAKDNKLGAITYSTKIYEVVVEVTDTGAGNLDAEIVSVDGAPLAEGEEAEFTFRFTNEYHATGSFMFDGRKTVNVNAATGEIDLTPQRIADLNEKVGFELQRLDEKTGEYVTIADSTPIGADGTFGFIFREGESLSYNETEIGDEFDYQIVEVAKVSETEMGGYGIDDTKFGFHVTVADGDAHDGHLKLTVTDADGNMLDETAPITVTFNNSYAATGALAIDAVKAMENPETKLGTFKFVVLDANGKEIKTAENDAQGNISFEDIETYTLEDVGETFTYTVKEIALDENDDYIYDTTIYTVTVTLADKGDGTLDVQKAVSVENEAYTGVIRFVNDVTVEFNVNKTELGDNSKEVAGAEITVYEANADGGLDVDENGNITNKVVDSWISKEGETHDFGDKLKAGGSYVMRETVAPDGYAYTTDIEFSVTDNGEIETGMPKTTGANGETVYLVEDAPLHFNVNKTDITNDEEVEGAQLEVLDKDGKVVDSWTSKKGETHDFGSKLKAGESYTLREEVAPDGYAYVTDIEFTVEKDGTITTDMKKTTDEDGNETYLVEDKPLHFNVNKTDITNDEEVEGAQLEVLDKDGKVVDSWTSKKGETHDFGSKLKAGESYTLREEVAPDGYAYVTDIEFTVEKDGTITTDMKKTTDEDGNETYLVEDKPLHFNVNKTDITNDEEVEGAQLEVLDKDGKVVDSWTSKKGETYDFGSKLKAGESYTLREEVAPDGYAYVTDIEFKVEKDGTITTDMKKTTDEDGNDTYLVEDAPIVGAVTLKKHGPDGEELAGAAFQLYYKTDETESGWALYNNASYVTGIDGTLTVSGLKANEYYFVETEAPVGYVIETDENGEPVKYPFTIALDEADKTNPEVSVELDVTNAPDAKDTTLVVTKQLVSQNDELWNAVDATFYVALFEDEELTKQVSEVQPIVFENSNTSSTTFENLEIGKTYYVAETNADGVVLNGFGGALATGEMFDVDFYDDNVVTMTRGDGTKVVYFRNVFREIPEDFYREGQLTVTKQLLGADGTAKKSNKTFYAGIFDDAAFTKLSGKVSQNIVELAMNGTSSASNTVKVTVSEEGKTTVYVTEVDKNGNPVAGAASFKYDVTVDSSTVTMDLETLSAAVTITNQEREKESEEESEVFTEGSTEEEEGTVPSSTKAVKTGDETPIPLYVGLLLAAALLLILAFVLKRRKKS